MGIFTIGRYEDCYCAFCRNQRRIYRRDGLGVFNYIQAVGLGLLSSFLIWQELDPKALVVTVFFLISMEIFVRVRTRVELSCPHCGFDPILYRKDVAAACERVKTHLKERAEDPQVWLARKPPVRLPVKHIKKDSSREFIV
jgi:hypothetical protein